MVPEHAKIRMMAKNKRKRGILFLTIEMVLDVTAGAVGFNAANPALFGMLVWIGVNFNGVAPGEFGERISPRAVDTASFAL